VLNYELPLQGCSPCTAPPTYGTGGRHRALLRPVGNGQDDPLGRPERGLIGDDEHGWSDDGVFNFEGGCYAKAIRLSPEGEPEIYATTRMFGTILENASWIRNPRVDFDDTSITENTRISYPLTTS
jgi:phosphoenolpyruvate carboxykinase (ATP)